MGWIGYLWCRARTTREGQTITEYAMIMAAVAVVAFAAFVDLGRGLEWVTTTLTADLSAAISFLGG